MDTFSETLTSYFLRKGWIEISQVSWCKYMVKHRAMDVISLLWLVPVGCLVAPWYISLTFVLSYRFLRSRTGGYHAKTPHGCLFASTATQLAGGFLILHVRGTLLLFCILVVSSILIVVLSPANNAELHLSAEEIKALLPRIKLRLLFLWLLVFILGFFIPEMATSIILGVATTALLLLLSKIGIGVN